jgi:hypothetical protein
VQRKVVLLELNEVPFKVIDGYCSRRPDSNLAAILGASGQYVSVTEDRLALDPWISWPTLHRGVTDEVHSILHLGQVIADADSSFPPVWRLLQERGLSVGVFGSLHSSNLPPDASKYSFYLPDYFDSDATAHPESLLPFQELNLSMTRESARNVTRKIPWAAALKFAVTAPFLGLRPSTLFDLLGQLLRERKNPALRIRRRVYQPLIMMDLFLRQLSLHKPQFASFYTNHVAAAMHRYWAATFPEDYGAQRLDAEWIARYEHEIWFAMDKLDVMLNRLKRFIDANPAYTLVVASSMGQAAIAAEKTYEFLTILDMGAFMQALGVPPGAWKLRPSMVPCYSVVVDEPYRAVLLERVRGLEINGQKMKQDQRPVGPMSFDERQHGDFQFFVQFDNYDGPKSATLDSRMVGFAQLGVGLMAHEDGVNCTAQHVPEGSLFVYPHRPAGARTTVSTLDVVPSILAFFGLEKPSYMRGSSSISLVRTVG